MNNHVVPLRLDIALACVWEATARKLGNVHPKADFCGTTYLDFVVSAVAISESLGSTAIGSVGESILQAIRATRLVTRSNTNLGIVLLLAPLVKAADGITPYNFANDEGDAELTQSTLHNQLRVVLKTLTVRDAELTYEAIRLAVPGGMGQTATQDIRNAPTVTLREAMELAAKHDMIARQYRDDYAAVFEFGVPALQAALTSHSCLEAAIIELQLRWLAEFPDSLIHRKLGASAARDVQNRSRELLRQGGIIHAQGRAAGVELDRYLRSIENRLNPGTTADLITTCLFIALRQHKIDRSTPFHWNVPDWL